MIDLTMTPTRIKRAEQEWTRCAGGLPIRVEGTEIGAPIYGFGDELAIRRLADKMKCGTFGYSKNLGTWYFCNQK